MADILDELNTIEATKEIIRRTIEAKGVTVPPTAPFSAYAGYVAAIKGSGEGQPSLTSVIHDESLSGAGVDGDPLTVPARQKYYTTDILPKRAGVSVDIDFDRITPSPTATGLRTGDIISDPSGTLASAYLVRAGQWTAHFNVFLPSQMVWSNINGSPKTNSAFLRYVGDTDRLKTTTDITTTRTIVDAIQELYDIQNTILRSARLINGGIPLE